jgi:hypothetical protein
MEVDKSMDMDDYGCSHNVCDVASSEDGTR